MPVVNFINEGKNIVVKKGVSLTYAARKAGIFLETPCNGAGICGKCKVKVLDRSGLEIYEGQKKLNSKEIEEDIILACCSKVIGNTEVYTMDSKEKNLKILTKGTEKSVMLKPYFKKVYNDGKTEVYGEDKLVQIEDGDTTDYHYGITMDIGTTTLVCSLVDCVTGEEICSESSLNPQTEYGQDVVSRINYAREAEDGLSILYQCLVKAFNGLIEKVCQKADVKKEYIYEVIYTGNTTMIHLATNTDPHTIGQYPYVPLIKEACYFQAKEKGLVISPCGLIYLPSVISAYVGSDITAGILACDLDELEGTTLFIDIGTNGEMIMAKDGKLTATSTAAGPAFEGMNITFGMRAGDGALEYFKIDEKDDLELKTIGGGKIIGICGSGLFDMAGELVKAGIIDKTGRILKKEKAELAEKLKSHLTVYNGKAAFLIDNEVYLTLLDVRQIQLAKSAIRAGIEAMLGLNEIRVDKVDRIYIAGSFGYHLRAESLVNIGIIPKELLEKISFVGNTSKTGGNAFLLNVDCRKKIEKLAKEVTPLELSAYPGFEEMFVKYMRF